MKLNPQPTFLMPDTGAGSPPADLQILNPRRPRIRRVIAEHHPIEFEDGDPALDDLIELVGKDGMREFGQFVAGGFRMTELLGLIDDTDDQLPDYIVEDLKPQVPVLPVVSTRVKLAANALVIVALRGLGATIEGPYEESAFLPPSVSTSSKALAWKLLAVPGVSEVLDDGLWWAEVPPIAFDVHDPDDHWENFIPNPGYIVDLFLHGY